jgi:hypothetical protein
MPATPTVVTELTEAMVAVEVMRMREETEGGGAARAQRVHESRVCEAEAETLNPKPSRIARWRLLPICGRSVVCCSMPSRRRARACRGVEGHVGEL